MLTRLSLAAAVAAALAAGPAFADQGGNPHGGTPGAANAAQPATAAQPNGHGPATPATPAQPATHQDADRSAGSSDAGSHGSNPHGSSSHGPSSDHPESHGATSHSSNPSATHRTSDPPSHEQAKRTFGEEASPHANAGKTTICHATGSSTNPYVEITISNNALPAHTRHQDGRDVVPAPSGGCPGAAATTPAKTTTPTTQTAVTPSQAQTPGQTTAAGQTNATLPASLTGAGPLEAFRVPPQSGVLGAHAQSGSGPGGAAAPAANGTAPAAATLPSAATSPSRHVAGLPFTGLDLGLVAAIGLAALLAGTALRRAGRLSGQRR